MCVQMFDNIDINGMFQQRLCIYNVCMHGKCVFTDEMFKNRLYIICHACMVNERCVYT